MNEVLEKLLTALGASGGKVTYKEFVDSLSYQEQQLLPRAIKLGKSNGVIKQYVVWDADNRKNTHVIERVTAQAPESSLE